MSEILCTETNCDTPLSNGLTLCHDHTTKLEYQLDELPGALADLGAATIRATRYGANITAAHGDPALIVDLKASSIGWELAALIHSWTNLATEATHTRPANPRSPASCARWLRTQTTTIRQKDWAGDMLEEFTEALHKARRGSDKPADRAFAGMCPTTTTGGTECGSPLYARRGSGTVKCRTCGADWDVKSWRAEALHAAELHTGTAAEISRMLTDPTTEGMVLPSATIRQWASRKKLIHINGPQRLHALGNGQPVPAKLYQVRKVRNLWARMRNSKYGNPTLKRPRNKTGVAA